MKIDKLVSNIKFVDSQLRNNATQAVNLALTIRNWYIGYYIVEYEQKGEDRAQYGSNLIRKIAERIDTKGLSYRNLNLFRKFFLVYPQLMQLLSEKSDLNNLKILQALTAQSNIAIEPIVQSSTALLQCDDNVNVNSLDNLENKYILNLVQKVSFTHFVELIAIEDAVKRKFYELLILKTTLSVRELKRQISSLAYERVGFSEENEIALNELQKKIIPKQPTDVVKSHYLLEFLNINNPGFVEESDIENALINHLQEFILEVGNGFCFEARQKRIIIGEKYYFIDLVFYHRILKCHVLFELKVAAFEHVNAGQLNTYLNYYKNHFQEDSDNPPIGILLVTDKDNALVEYATAGMDENLFVSKYLLQLPNKKELENFIKTELKEM